LPTICTAPSGHSPFKNFSTDDPNQEFCAGGHWGGFQPTLLNSLAGDLVFTGIPRPNATPTFVDSPRLACPDDRMMRVRLRKSVEHSISPAE